MKKIMIAAPARDYDWVNKAVLTFIKITMSTPPGYEPITGIHSSVVHNARNHLFVKAQEESAEFLVFVDSDTVLIKSPEDILSHLIRQADKYQADVIGGIIPMAKISGNQLRTVPNIYDLHTCRSTCSWPNQMTNVEFIGAGFLFITKKVLNAFTPAVIKEIGLPFDYLGTMGEDISFCYRLKMLGFKIWADPEIEFGHQKSIVLTKETDGHGVQVQVIDHEKKLA